MSRLRAPHLALLVLALSACPSLDPPVMFQEDFEGCKDLCGLTTTGPGEASIVETIHPGEHGLRLSGDVVASILFRSPISADSISWVSDGVVTVEVEPASDDAGGEIMLSPSPLLDDKGQPILETDAGFHTRSAVMHRNFDDPDLFWSVSFRHIASSPPATIDAVRLLGINTNPGCY